MAKKDKAAEEAGTKQAGAEAIPAPPAPPQEPPAGDPPPAEEKPKKGGKPRQLVRVICDGPLGTKLLRKGDITSDPAYVALLEKEGQTKVEAV